VPDITAGLVPDDLVAAMPFARELGVTLENAESARVVGSLAWVAHHCTTGGALHGGVLMGLADSLGGICAFLNLPAGSLTSTIESKTNFFRAVRSGTVRGVASPVHVGRTTIVVQTELRDDAQRLVAVAIQTQAVLEPRS
jgi:1,4-dihydroxy-2-naphthoyl-CoA hydrolase